MMIYTVSLFYQCRGAKSVVYLVF